MNRRNPCAQRDLFSNASAPPMLMALQLQHDDLVELLSRLLWDVAQATNPSIQETGDEQDKS